MVGVTALFRQDWPFSFSITPLYSPTGRRLGFFCAQVGCHDGLASLIGRRTTFSPSNIENPRGQAEAEVKTPWQSSRTSGKQGRLWVVIGRGCTKPHRYREREDVRRQPYLEKEISEEHFAPCTMFDRLSLFRRQYAHPPFLFFRPHRSTIHVPRSFFTRLNIPLYLRPLNFDG